MAKTPMREIPAHISELKTEILVQNFMHLAQAHAYVHMHAHKLTSHAHKLKSHAHTLTSHAHTLTSHVHTLTSHAYTLTIIHTWQSRTYPSS